MNTQELKNRTKAFALRVMNLVEALQTSIRGRAIANQFLSGILYGVRALDPIAFTVAPLVLTIDTLIATWLPARRATRVNPVQALRAE
jgi:ABC-type lipoprotein release transport system permease subunit